MVPFERETLNKETMFNDIVTTALRTSEGINLGYVEKTLGSTYKKTLLDNAARHIKEGLLTSDGRHLKLTHDGIFISDMVMSDLMIV